MPSPIDNNIGTVFIPVSDMPRAIAWYSRLFGLSVETATHEGKIYNVPMVGEAGLILDGHKRETRKLPAAATGGIVLLFALLLLLSGRLVGSQSTEPPLTPQPGRTPEYLHQTRSWCRATA